VSERGGATSLLLTASSIWNMILLSKDLTLKVTISS
jgi:hypothetical protein